MRLYLSSFRLGSHSDRLLSLTGAARRTAVVCNALDAEPRSVRVAGVERELGELRSIGLDTQAVDLRQPMAVQRLEGYDFVWVRGGNTFVLRRILADSGADLVLVDLIHRGGLVYGRVQRRCMCAGT